MLFPTERDLAQCQVPHKSVRHTFTSLMNTFLPFFRLWVERKKKKNSLHFGLATDLFVDIGGVLVLIM